MAEESHSKLSLDRNLIRWTAGVAVLAIVLGLGAFLLLNYFLKPVPGLELLKVILTLIAGLGGVVYLVVRFRTQIINEADDRRKEASSQRDEEQFIEDKLFRAIEMLGAEAVSTKIAGVYALTDISDTYGGRYKQRVVDILCGYLRSARPAGEVAVESTVVSAIFRRTTKIKPLDGIKPQEYKAWSSCSMNLDGAHFRAHMYFDELVLSKALSMSGCVFEGHLMIARCELESFFCIGSHFKYGLSLYDNRSGRFILRDSRFSKANIQIDHPQIDLKHTAFESSDNVEIAGYTLEEEFNEEFELFEYYPVQRGLFIRGPKP
ncbi:hypothetical protein [Rothia amarae]|uniref:hypothetical protein n=1 Tax=Rothia amarae TaxID=169480 RepID=UPI0031D8C23A